MVNVEDGTSISDDALLRKTGAPGEMWLLSYANGSQAV
jgi:hypothetical protein